MPDMDVDPPDRQTLCCKRYDLFSTIESEEILVSNFNEVINVPDTPQNYQMKEIVKKQIREHQQAKDAALTELDTIPPSFFEKSPISLSFSHPAHCSIQSIASNLVNLLSPHWSTSLMPRMHLHSNLQLQANNITRQRAEGPGGPSP
ncbi:hypothetical protein TNCT_201601 [Trichonephila clavata]|uniref:Uncharacterized protein n=1 Tax=Trichonephila clavata TaxID=2740835 RepID=A0A8X6K4W7_TRICU|nr:hypothetical protein TNCT_201601 [Trichonephila clavata]